MLPTAAGAPAAAPVRPLAVVLVLMLVLVPGIVPVPGIVAIAGAATTPAPPPEADLVRQIKVDVFDENWNAVLRGCEDLLARYPSSPAAPQAAFYRARALSRSPGRETDAVAAFRDFVTRHPGDKLLSEQAWTSLFTLACDARRVKGSTCSDTLDEGLSNTSAYVSTLAAIRASDTRDEALRGRALVVLKKALSTQSEPDIRNEILIAILKIDPKQVPPPAPRVAPAEASATGAASGHAPTLIRMTIFNKEEGRYDLKINLPVAFAQMLLNSLGEDARSEMRREAGRRGINLDDVFEAIQKAGTGRFLEVDTEESRIEVWIE
jgi:hypothetical protein